MKNAYAVMEFQEEALSQKIIHQLKYRSQEKVGKIMAEWTLERIYLSEKPDVLITVPFILKIKKRGYNQLHLFADTLSKNWEIPHHKEALKRNSYQKAQTQKRQISPRRNEIRFLAHRRNFWETCFVNRRCFHHGKYNKRHCLGKF